MQRLALLTAATAAVLFTTSAQAAVIAQYNFEAAVEPSGPVYTIASVDSDALTSATNFVLSAAIQPSGAAVRPTGIYDDSTTFGFTGTGSFKGGLVVSQGSTDASANATKYAEFSVTPSANYELDLDSFAFWLRLSNNGDVATIALRSSLDNYTNDIGTVTTNSATASTRTFDLTALSLQNLQNTTTFRLFFSDNSTNVDRNIRVDNVTLNATVALVPEPTSTMAIVAGAGLLALRRRARA